MGANPISGTTGKPPFKTVEVRRVHILAHRNSRITMGIRIIAVRLALTQEAEGQYLYPQPNTQRR